MEAGLDEHAAGLDLARDLFLVELPVRLERDQGRRGFFAVAVLERLLHRLQLGPVHARILEAGLSFGLERSRPGPVTGARTSCGELARNYRRFTRTGRQFGSGRECDAYTRTQNRRGFRCESFSYLYSPSPRSARPPARRRRR